MDLIDYNQELVLSLTDNNSLLDSVIEKFEIFMADGHVNANVWLQMRPSSEFGKVQLKFTDCKEYSFSYTDDYYFYNVELVKLFKTKDGMFYVSFDPVDEQDEVSNEDQDFILARGVSGYSLH